MSQVLVWGVGPSSIEAIRTADACTDAETLLLVEDARGSAWELTGDRWVVIVEDVEDHQLDRDPAVRGYSREAVRS